MEECKELNQLGKVKSHRAVAWVEMDDIVMKHSGNIQIQHPFSIWSIILYYYLVLHYSIRFCKYYQSNY